MIAEWGSKFGVGNTPCPAPGAQLSNPHDGTGSGRLASRWHVLQTRPRHEKAVAELMQSSGAEPFLPVIRRVMHYAHRRRTVEVPLFSNYVFVWGTLETAYRAITSRHAVRTVAVNDQRTFSHELDQIRRAINGEAACSPYRYLRRGVRVRVASGPLKDVEGLVEDDVRHGRLVLQIQTLGRAASLEIDACLLRRVDDEFSSDGA